MTDLTTVTATELSGLYQSGAVSPVTVAQQVLHKIERLNPVLNAFCFVDPTTTLAQAQASEQRWHLGQPLSALDGIPIAIKDSILTQGWPTLHASRAIDPDQPWAEDAPAIARLREAGAVFAGKTTMSEFGLSEYHSNSLLYGDVINPWNRCLATGGSSGGSAVSVAAGLVPVALGTDFGGSIAVPSAFCGVFGMKPSTGRIPQYPVDALESSTVGPLARSTADIALIMNIISKPDVRDGTSLPYDNVDYTLYKEVLLPRKKIACIKFGEDADIKPMHKIIDHLTSMGNQIDFISLDVESGMKIFSKLSDTKILHRWLNIPNDLRTLTGRHTQRRAILALAHEKEDTYSQLINRHDLITSMREIMQSYDVLLGPVTTWQSDRQIDPAEIVSPLSSFFCMTRQPTITVPIGVDSNGTPMSVMIAGGMYNDTQVLQVASAIEKQFPMPLCPVIL